MAPPPSPQPRVPGRCYRLRMAQDHPPPEHPPAPLPPLLVLLPLLLVLSGMTSPSGVPSASTPPPYPVYPLPLPPWLPSCPGACCARWRSGGGQLRGGGCQPSPSPPLPPQRHSTDPSLGIRRPPGLPRSDWSAWRGASLANPTGLLLGWPWRSRRRLSPWPPCQCPQGDWRERRRMCGSRLHATS